MYQALVIRKTDGLVVHKTVNALSSAEAAKLAKLWIKNKAPLLPKDYAIHIKFQTRRNPSVPKKGVWTKVKAVKFNKDGSVSLMK